MSPSPTAGRALHRGALLATLIALSANLAGCAAVKGIFKAGVWSGVFVVVVLVVLVVGGLSLFRGRTR